MRQVTLVAFYGEKPDELSTLITQCQEWLISILGDAFSPYDIQQVHATIVGLERRIGSARDNANFWKYRALRAEMDFREFLAFLRGCSQIPFEVQIGGFEKRDYPFVSDPFEKGTDNRPYDRMFSIQGDKVVVIGWPVRSKSPVYPLTLDDIRRAAQKFGILHGYHQTLTAVDNDLFFRIGLVDRTRTSSGVVNRVVQKLRDTLAGILAPVISQVTLNDLFVASYEDDKLPMASTQAWSLVDERVNAEFVAGLFG
jgi:hypothetical protein